MAQECKIDPTQPSESLSADRQIERVVNLIAEQFNGDTTAYFEAIVRPAIASEFEEQVQEERSVESFLRSYR